MIADTERLIDGFRGLPAGMDGSKEPPQTSSEAAWYATNVTFRGGNGPKTRPGFREIPTDYWRNPQPVRVATITISSGIATATVSGGHGYDNLDKVTIAGASPAGVNGTRTITVTGSDTFTFPVAASGTVTGTITARRDIDAAYQNDVIDGTTSRDRFIAIRGAILVQGVFIYQDPRENNPSQMVIVADGLIYALNFADASCYLLNATEKISDDVQVYMVQAEKYLIIQTGKDEPRVYDGYVLRRASYYGSQVVPVGKQMTYGQGRLFVSVNEGSEIIAGDLVFGGSTTNVGVVSSSAANPTVITTASEHGFSVGNQITIQGHSSSPPINSTYTVLTTPTTTTFTISLAVTSAGTGGFVSRFNAGQDSDLLRFTENTFLNEGGSFAPTGKVGRITGLVFLPVQDTSTGQGDLVAFCERGAATFQVSAPRDQWKSVQGFQRVLFDNIGSTSDSIIPINGDLFFRSREGNGIRSYRNARAESANYGLTPLSAEIDPVLKQDTQWMLDGVTFASLDNRLLMTCLPKQYPRRAIDQTQADTFASQPIPTLYNGIAVLDFQSVSVGRGKSSAVFDGVWTGLQIYKLIHGTFDGKSRCFAVCTHEDETSRRNEMWEITTDDEFDTPVEGRRVIKAGVVTKAYSFEKPMDLKKLIRCDLWFNDIGGGSEFPFKCELAYRPDDYPNFTQWESFERKFQTEFDVVAPSLVCDFGTLGNLTIDPSASVFPAFVSQNATELSMLHSFSNTAGLFFNAGAVDLSYITNLNNLEVVMKVSPRNKNTPVLFSVEFLDSSTYVALFTGVYDGVNDVFLEPAYVNSLSGVVAIQITTNSTNSAQDIDFFKLLYWPQKPMADTTMGLERGYAPQVRFPAPPRTANLATDVPAYLGHDFTFKVNWEGRAHLGRMMVHANRLVENVGGGTL